MSRVLSILMFIGVLIGITACEPVYKTEYAYQPPNSATGRMCVSQCNQNKSMCEQMCQMRNDNCVQRARQDAIYQYENYRDEQMRHNEKIKKSLSDFDTSYSCRTHCKCVPAFNTCYNSCGGDVLERKKCVAFCGDNK